MAGERCRGGYEQHEKIGTHVPPIADRLITVGVRARMIAEGALAAGMPEQHILQYDKADRAGKELQNLIEPGDMILIKASQGLRAERIVKEVMAEPRDAEQLLVRQSDVWLNR